MPGSEGREDVCAVHQHGWVEDCDACQADVAAAKDEYQAIVERNEQKGKALTREGGRLDPGSLLELKLQTLMDLLLADKDRHKVEIVFAQRVGEVLDGALSDIRRAKLTHGVQGGMPKNVRDIKKR